MFLTEARLEGFMEVVCVKVGLSLCSNPLKCCGDEGEVGDGSVTVKDSWVSTGFFRIGVMAASLRVGLQW